MKTLRNDWKLGAAVGTALSLGSAGAIAGPHGFDLHNVLNGASAAMAGTSIAHVEDPVSAVFGNPATLTTYYGGTNFMFGATFYMPRATMVHDGSAGYAVSGTMVVLDTLVVKQITQVQSTNICFLILHQKLMYMLYQLSCYTRFIWSWYSCCTWCRCFCYIRYWC